MSDYILEASSGHWNKFKQCWTFGANIRRKGESYCLAACSDDCKTKKDSNAQCKEAVKYLLTTYYSDLGLTELEAHEQIINIK